MEPSGNRLESATDEMKVVQSEEDRVRKILRWQQVALSENFASLPRAMYHQCIIRR